MMLEMVDVVIEVMIEASKCISKDGLDMFWVQRGDFLVRKDVVSLKVDFQKLLA